MLVDDRYREEEVALKLLLGLPADHEIDALRREFALLAEIEHPCIARAYDFGYAGGVPYFTSEYIDGLPLGAGHEPAVILRHARDIAEAVAFLHRAAIVHLDIKPGNILLAADTGKRSSASTPSQDRRDAVRPKLIDFGLFRRGVHPGAGDRIGGSVPYMAPECFRGGEIGPWTDVYALGVTLYRALTGAYPRPGAVSVEACLGGAAWSIVPAPPSRSCRPLSADLDDVILRCLALDRESRFPSAGELCEALRRAVDRRGNPGAKSVPGGTAAGTIGRRRELDALESYLRSALGREPPKGDGGGRPPIAAIVTGPPGMGQSHLLRALKVRAQTRGMPCYLEARYPGGQSAPGSLLRCVAAHIPDRSARRRWEAFLERLRAPRRASRHETSEDERRLRRAGEVSLALEAVEKRFVLAVDGLQFADEVSLSLLVELLRAVGKAGPSTRPPVAVVLGYREEGPSRSLLRELTDELLARGCPSVSLRPLDLEETAELYRGRAGDESGGARAFDVFHETGGVPARVVGLASAIRVGEAGESAAGSDGAAPRGRLTGALERASGEERRLLVALALLARPAATPEICALTGLRASFCRRVLSRLCDLGHVVAVDDDSGRREWLVEPAVGEWARSLEEAERRRAHLRIASALSRRARRDGDPLHAEIARHLRAAGRRSGVVRHGLLAARFLKATFQNRAALESYRMVLDALPRGRTAARFETAREMAELEVRIGDLQSGIDLLTELLSSSPRLSGSSRTRALLWLATLYGRKGDYRRASRLFSEGFDGTSAARLKREERLFFINELASLAMFTGDHGEALRLCERGLKIAARGRSFKIREMALNLHATRANVRLREFDGDGAVRDFETALEIAEAVGSPVNQAVILNNLGIVHSNGDRYEAAIDAYRRARRLSERLDEGPSLVSILANLAILHAKTGRFDVTAESLRSVEVMGAAAMGRKTELFVAHTLGLCRLYEGRYIDAIPHLEKAIAIAGEVGDGFVAAFERVSLAESCLFAGRYGEASSALVAIAGGPGPATVRKMALARLVLLRGILGDAGDVARLAEEYRAVEETHPVAFLEAWNRLFIAWGRSIAFATGSAGSLAAVGSAAEGAEATVAALLDASLSFFEERGVRPGAAVARWVRAEHFFLQGQGSEARRALDACPPDGNAMTSALHPLLAARLSMGEASGAARRGRCGDLLSEAGERLVGNRLPEWDLRVEAMRERLRGGEAGPSGAGARRLALAKDLPAEERRVYLASGWWARWVGDVETAAGATRGDAGDGRGDRAIEHDATPASSRTVLIPGRAAAVSRCDLVVRSPAMKRLAGVLDRIRRSDLPVLIRGETGSGKEFIARIIHDESRRRDGPFVVVDCAAIPETLLEAELFGARAGAFTDLAEDRPGILAAASGGTVLVDEVARIALPVQRKLARAIAQRTVRRLGDDVETPVEARFLFSTSEDIEEAVREGRLAEDFAHRVRGLSLVVPPLRERHEDLPALVDALAREAGERAPVFGPGAIARLAAHRWPGNVRELKNVVARLAIERSGQIAPEDVERELPDAVDTVFPPRLLGASKLDELRERLEREYVLFHLERLGGDTRALSRLLGITRVQLYRRCHRLGIRLREARRRRKG